MLRFGIKSRLRSAGNIYGHPQWTVDVRGVADKRRFLEEIGVPVERTAAVMRALERLGPVTAAGGLDTIPPGVWERVRRVLDDRAVAIPGLRTSAGTRSRGDLDILTVPARRRLRRIAEALGDAGLE